MRGCFTWELAEGKIVISLHLTNISTVNEVAVPTGMNRFCIVLTNRNHMW